LLVRLERQENEVTEFLEFRLGSAIYERTNRKNRLNSGRSSYWLKVKRLKKTNYDRLTHAYVHWLPDVHLAGFAPAFTLSFHDSECSRKPPMPIASVVIGHFRKKKTETTTFTTMNYFSALRHIIPTFLVIALCTILGLAFTR